MGLFLSSSSSSVLSLVLFIVFFAFAFVINKKLNLKSYMGFNESWLVKHEQNYNATEEFRKPESNRYALSDELPVSIDWREKGAVVDVKHQGQCGSCWAFAAIAVVEGLNKIETDQLISLSEQELVDCIKTWFTDGCNGGLTKEALEFIIKNGGINYERHYPYKVKKRKCQKHTKHSKVVSIGGYEHVRANDEKALQRVVARQPVAVTIDGGGLDFKYYKSGIFTRSCGIKLNHAVVIVGYGTDENGMDYWIVKNSWGTEWGENGYIRIQRNFAGTGKCGIAMEPLYPTMKSTALSVTHRLLLLACFISRAIISSLFILLPAMMITIAARDIKLYPLIQTS